MNNLAIFLTFILACISPTIGFSSLNTQFFTNSQIAISITVSFLLGVAGGLLGIWMAMEWPLAASYVPVVAILFFIVLNERFFSGIFSKKIYGAMAALGLLFIALGTAWLGRLWVAPSILLVYGLTACFDLAKNWKRQKTPLFDPSLLRPGKKPAKPAQFIHKPNVYLLLLESMHSSEALREIYQIDCADAEKHMIAHGLRVYPNTFSNKHSTPLSLKTLLSMSLDYQSPPDALRVFKHNGYDCYFFDTMSYLAAPYALYLDNDNASVPLRVRKLYTIAGPLLAQSAFLSMLAGNVDPFETASPSRSFETMRSEFLKHLEKKKKRPCFHMLHFGAQHFGDLWHRIPHPGQTYMEWYKRGSAQLEMILRDIINKDPNALIIAIGDHGAYHWNGVAAGSACPEENAAANGISTIRLVQDYFGVVLGMRWQEGQLPEAGVISHVNIFRHVFALLSGKSKQEGLEKNISIFMGTHIAVKEGVPLKVFEPLTDKRFSDYYTTAITDPALMLATQRLEKKLAENQLDQVDKLSQELKNTAWTSTPFTLQHFNAAQALVKAGKMREGIELLEKAWASCGASLLGFEPYSYLVEGLCALGKLDQAEQLIRTRLHEPKWPKRLSMLYLMRIYWCQKQYASILPLIKPLLNTKRNLVCEPIDRLPHEAAICMAAIEKVQGSEAALSWVNEQLETFSGDDSCRPVFLIQKLFLYISNGNYREALAILGRELSQDSAPAGFAVLYLRLAIIMGDYARAKDFQNCLDCFPSLKKNALAWIAQHEICGKGSSARLAALQLEKTFATRITSSGLFDEEWYAATYKPDLPPVLDFIRNGTALLRNPNPDFDMRFFLGITPLVFLQALEPLLFFATNGRLLPASLDDDNFIRAHVHPAFLQTCQEQI